MAPLLNNPEHIAWEDAAEAIREWLAGPPFNEKVLEIHDRDPIYGPGQIIEKEISRIVGASMETTKDRAYTFNGVQLKVENAKGDVREAEYIFRFHWQGDQWKIIQPPGVCF